MSKNKTSWLTIIGAIIVILGILAYLVDPTLNFWQLESELNGFWYLNAFGFLLEEGEAAYSWGDQYVIAGLLMAIGAGVAILTSAKGWKTLSVIAGVVIIAGIGYFIYVHINYNQVNSQIDGFLDMANAVWGAGENIITIDYTWRLGNGFFISSVGAILTLIAAIRMK